LQVGKKEFIKMDGDDKMRRAGHHSGGVNGQSC